jgi:type I restriction enzyme, S subunit
MKMKDSGVSWNTETGETKSLPIGWQMFRIKDVAKLQSGNFIAADQIEPDGIFPVYGGNGLRGYTPSFTHSGAYVLVGRQGALCGNVNYATGKFWATEHAVVVHPKRAVITQWLGEMLRCINLNQYATASAQPGLSVESITNLFIPFPPLFEQRAIAAYLAQQTALIDKRLSTLEEKKIVLAELRKATIHEAVTKGLNKNAPMKDLGVGCIGLVPMHWLIARLKDVAKLNPSTVLPKLDEINFFPMEAIGVDGGLTFGQRKPVSQSSGYSQMKNGDVCFAKVTPCFENGKSAIVEGLEFGVALATTEITILRPNKKINRHFLHYRIKGLDFAAGGANEMKGAGGLKRVPERFAAEFVFQLPPLTEQLAIANHLDQQTQQIDAQLATLDEQAQVLKELRKAIIHEAVTGKIDLSKEAYS